MRMKRKVCSYKNKKISIKIFRNRITFYLKGYIYIQNSLSGDSYLQQQARITFALYSASGSLTGWTAMGWNIIAITGRINYNLFRKHKHFN